MVFVFLYFLVYFLGCFGLSGYLYLSHKFFRKKRGIITLFISSFVFTIIHNILSFWLFPLNNNAEEPFFLFLAFMGIGMSFFLFVFYVKKFQAKHLRKELYLESGFGKTFNPVISCHIISEGPPFEAATTGFPELHASNITIPKGSWIEGRTNISQA